MFHAGVYKTIPLRERLRLRPGVGGVAQYDEAGPRSFRAGLRLEW